MNFLLLGVLFIAVFAFIAWRIIASAPANRTTRQDGYSCPICNEQHCDCHKDES